ncbi:putative spermidine/putrescine transport system substrate-binding protein [Pseudomonas delhiensis]|uniref:Spermidine/putrescine transport system substrate-binding protein n=1 Tax=Pseudomonas delhiensis TaxID=366289 RepID=A0A239FT25_9PSED|nr:ABC transporter substrate-binding protein [Pseudomonas delhiensis]SDI72594.1 putative spermidine/putrescine transport system substrate-binding protein [Pseudomonas delhiensis]SNS59990.1 putative spermidine/putrescine transport system substrate-binding protein [Pseudomonas delhiensis]
MHKSLSSAITLALACLAGQAHADITVVSHGGANKAAQVKAFYEPYAAQAGSRVIADEFNGEMAKVKVQVDTGSVSWDVVEMEMPELARACDEGLLEEIGEDPAIARLAPQLLEGAVQPCGVGFFVWSTVLAYNADKLKTAPTSWADFWDLQKYPGKRGLRKGAMYTLEFALMADGVAPKEVYAVLATKEGQDRAFRKLDQIKPSIQWWEAGAQPPQYLVSGDVVMSSVYNGRIAAVQNESNLRIVWNGGIYDMDAFTIPKGARRAEEGRRFIEFVLQTEQQKAYAQQIAYGPVNTAAVGQVDEARRRDMPTDAANLANQVQMNAAFWADHGEQLEQRFNAWAAR